MQNKSVHAGKINRSKIAQANNYDNTAAQPALLQTVCPNGFQLSGCQTLLRANGKFAMVPDLLDGSIQNLLLVPYLKGELYFR